MKDIKCKICRKLIKGDCYSYGRKKNGKEFIIDYYCVEDAQKVQSLLLTGSLKINRYIYKAPQQKIKTKKVCKICNKTIKHNDNYTYNIRYNYNTNDIMLDYYCSLHTK